MCEGVERCGVGEQGFGGGVLTGEFFIMMIVSRVTGYVYGRLFAVET